MVDDGGTVPWFGGPHAAGLVDGLVGVVLVGDAPDVEVTVLVAGDPPVVGAAVESSTNATSAGESSSPSDACPGRVVVFSSADVVETSAPSGADEPGWFVEDELDGCPLPSSTTAVLPASAVRASV